MRRGFRRASATRLRVAGLSDGATESSRSRITASASRVSAFSTRRATLPGAKRKERFNAMSCLFPLSQQLTLAPLRIGQHRLRRPQLGRPYRERPARLDLHDRGLDPGLLPRLRVDLVAAERSEEHTSELQSRLHLVCRLLLEKKKAFNYIMTCFAN